MNDQVAQDVISLVAEELGVRAERLSLQTRLLHDLGCGGDDAAELINAFARRYGVDTSRFELGRHFGPEASFNPLLYLYWRLFKPEKLRIVPVTVGDLVEAARTKRLQNPERPAV